MICLVAFGGCLSSVALGQTFTVQGNITATGELTAGDTAHFQHDLQVDRNAGINGDLAIGNNLTGVKNATMSGILTVTGAIIVPTTSTNPSSACTPGQLLMGPGGSNSNGKGGYLYFCRLGGTWGTANFQNWSMSLAAEDQNPDSVIMVSLQDEVKQLKAIVCTDHPKAKICAPQSAKAAQ
ncbi:hypothetical protein ABENE_07820 [Asticcacaulis benevestitus DSM 16100 = ATCC BAA-896]|uniref:Uncharacterized protein n=2 Tax=Asticcacaulis TaxID=76890 RepID=V4Q3V4_9CAUL|nr:hypothetical protein ABENE_07820 [Asticcacaulis benevestitus DSM 16100 = ATCC BAA-896]